MGQYRKKPVVIEAVQLRWDTWQEMCDHAGVGKLSDGKPEGVFVNPDNTPVSYNGGTGDGRIAIAIPTLEGLMIGVENDWIIRGVKGEIYPCKPDIFEATYEPASALASRPTQSDRECAEKIRNSYWSDGDLHEVSGLEKLEGIIAAHVASALRAKEKECGELFKRSLEALSEAREMLGVFEDNGGHDGLGGKGYLATIDHIDECKKMIRALLSRAGGGE